MESALEGSGSTGKGWVDPLQSCQNKIKRWDISGFRDEGRVLQAGKELLEPSPV